MKSIANLLLPIVLLAAAETAGGAVSGQPAPDASQQPQDPHVNRHVEAHVPAQVGESPATERDERGRRSSVDSSRGVMRPGMPVAPFAGQPLRDRRY
jgi:hypothetical protein